MIYSYFRIFYSSLKLIAFPIFLKFHSYQDYLEYKKIIYYIEFYLKRSYLFCFLLITNTTVKPIRLTTSKAEPNVFNTKLLLNPVLGKDLSIFFPVEALSILTLSFDLFASLNSVFDVLLI